MDNKHKSLRRDGIIVMDDTVFKNTFLYSLTMNYKDNDTSVDSFFNFVRKLFVIPHVITKKNVNDIIHGNTFKTRLMEITTLHYNNYKYVFPYIMSLEAIITAQSFVACEGVYVRPLLEYGYNPAYMIRPCLGIGRDIFLLIDFGAKIPEWTKTEVEHYKIEEIEAYASLSDRRVQECRKALLALLWCCGGDLSLTKGPFGGGAGFAGRAAFGALRGIIVQMTIQVWRLRGGEGCGPRGHKWI